MKFIAVTGGVISGVGKGIIASSIGTILKSHGVKVTSIKIDPYINIDAGTFSPDEHGEVFVLDDGGEVDLDFGNYEQFLDATLTRDNNITTGKIFLQVIEKERRGDFLGKTVQVIPHITDAIQNWMSEVADKPVDGDQKADVCIIELGGTIGDIEGPHFVEALRQFQFKVKPENICYVHVSLIPELQANGEQKTKPTQSSVSELRSHGISPDMIVCRSVRPLVRAARDKISLFGQVEPEQVYSVQDVTCVYRIPYLLHSQGVDSYLIQRLQLKTDSRDEAERLISKWNDLADRHDNLKEEITIALVGKYTKNPDSYASVLKALQHASVAPAVGRKLDLKLVAAGDLEPAMAESNEESYNKAWEDLRAANGVIVPGGFDERGTEGKILACQWARTNKVPFLGVCLGLQCAVVEFARNVLEWKGANSTELGPETEHPVVIDMPEHNAEKKGGTMRLGKRKTIFKTKKSILYQLYGNRDVVEERHRHRYEVNSKFVEDLEAKGMKFVGHSEDGQRMEIMELEDHPYYVGVQYHPEYISRPMKPSPPYLGLLLASCNKLHVHDASQGCDPVVPQ